MIVNKVSLGNKEMSVTNNEENIKRIKSTAYPDGSKLNHNYVIGDQFDEAHFEALDKLAYRAVGFIAILFIIGVVFSIYVNL